MQESVLLRAGDYAQIYMNVDVDPLKPNEPPVVPGAFIRRSTSEGMNLSKVRECSSRRDYDMCR